MRREPFQVGAVYHLYHRGVNHQPVFFFASQNWAFSVARLRRYAAPECMTVIAYCLMPNHFHLLARAMRHDLGERAMQPLLVSYTKAINREQGRCDSLFGRRFQSRQVRDDDDLVQLSAHIHLNPLHAGLIAKPHLWTYSRYQDYVGLRSGTLPDSSPSISRAGSIEEYAEYVATYRGDRATLEYLLADYAVSPDALGTDPGLLAPSSARKPGVSVDAVPPPCQYGAYGRTRGHVPHRR